MPEVLVLDLGKVVFELDWKKPIEILNLEQSRFHKILTTQIQTWAPYDQYERGKLSTEEFLSFVNQTSSVPIELENFGNAWCSLITGFMPGMPMLLEELSTYIPIYALTNTNPLHYDYIMREFPEMKVFKKVFTSIHTGFRKPEREIFEHVAEHIEVDPSKILYVDDCIGHVESAKICGFVAEQYLGSSALDLRRLLWKYKVSP